MYRFFKWYFIVNYRLIVHILLQFGDVRVNLHVCRHGTSSVCGSWNPQEHWSSVKVRLASLSVPESSNVLNVTEINEKIEINSSIMLRLLTQTSVIRKRMRSIRKVTQRVWVEWRLRWYLLLVEKTKGNQQNYFKTKLLINSCVYLIFSHTHTHTDRRTHTHTLFYKHPLFDKPNLFHNKQAQWPN